MTRLIKTTLSAITLIILTGTLVCAEMVSINGNDVNLRTGPGQNNPVKFELGKGFPLKVVSQKGEWLKVSDFEDDTGWVHKSLVSSTPHMVVKVNRNSKKKINIRSGPSTNTQIVGKAYYGVVFKTLEQKPGWTKVRHEGGLEGWISRKLLWGF